MREHFCTYFDHRYAAKGLAMWRSLKEHHPGAVLHVLCLTHACREMLAALQLADVLLYPLAELEARDSELRRARGDRSLIEYYFTLTPCLPLYVFETDAGIARLTYVDADLFFFADPRPILDEVGDNAIGVIEHRFPLNLTRLEAYGRFNVGWLTFRNDPVALSCLSTWRNQCLEWCYDRLEPDRFAEQKYLDRWPDEFERVAVIRHPGANVAAWNLERSQFDVVGDELLVDGERLLFFHAHGFEPAAPGRSRELNLAKYGVSETPLLVERIFQPYEQALLRATADIALPLALALLGEHSRATGLELAATRTHTARLEEQLAASEADRAARLHGIEWLQEQLQVSEADRAARLDVILRLQAQLTEKDAERIQAPEAVPALRDVQERLDALQRSRSWRWTRPARMISRLLTVRE